MSNDNVKIYPLNPTPHPERALGLIALLTIALGNVFSASVYALQAPASGLTGRSAWLAFALAVVIGLVTIFPVLMVSGALIFRGGDFSLVQLGVGKKGSGLFAWLFILMCIGPAISVSALGGYVTTLWPNANGKVIALLIVTAIFLLNITPIKVISRAQNVMFILLCASSAIYVIYGLTHLNPGAFDFSSENYFPGGLGGFIKAATTFTATTSFYVQAYALGGDAKNPRKHIPTSMLITACVIFFLYPIMTLVNSNTLPWEQTAGMTMVGTASQLLPKGLFIFFVICGPFLATATTLNAGFLALPKPFAAAADAGWLPKALKKTNRWGSPIWALTLLWLVAIIPVILLDNVMVIANMTILSQNIIKIIPLIAAWRIPKLFPEFWETGLFRKMPIGLFYVIMGFCTIVQLALIASSISNLKPIQVGVGLGLIVIFCIIAVIWEKTHKNDVDKEIDRSILS